jgi:iron complex transport system substrate-binding protein
LFTPSSPRLLTAATLLALLAAGCASQTTTDATTSETTATEAVAEATATEAATGTTAGGIDANLVDGCAEVDDPDVDWFPDKVTFDAASGIRVDYDGNVKLVTIDRPTDDPSAEPITVALVQCGTTADVQADVVVEVPVDSVATYSTTFLQGFELIDRVDAISAHGGLSFVSSEAITAAADAGDIVEVGDQTAPDLEALAAAEPDVVMVSAGFGGADAVEPFAALDVPVIPNASYLETEPVARAEWMKLEAMLLNEEAAVVPVFDQIAADYAELTELVADVEERPTVLVNAPFEGTWFVSGGDSYTNAIIRAAGGEYVFADLEGSTEPLDLETVLAEAQDADVWLQAGSVATPPDQFLADDERLGEFTAFPDRVYANDADLGPTGGNQFFEVGAVRPDLVLADVIAILHPDLLPDHELRFYGLVGSQTGAGETGAGETGASEAGDGG